MRFLSRYARKRSGNQPMSQIVREAIDYLPDGICFSDLHGRIILTNRKMNELIYTLTGHTVINLLATWEELTLFCASNGCVKLNEPWISEEVMGGYMFFGLPDGRIWRFCREELRDRAPYYIQLEATEISELYQHSKALYENNKKLSEQHERQQILLSNIVEINQEKELLSMKMRIHDDLGQSILTTKQYLSNQTLPENASHLIEIWDQTIRNLSDLTQASASAEASPEIELQKVAEMIGCRIDFCGDRPVGRKAELLFYAAVREGLTNAVRHASADRLIVCTRPVNRGYYVEISDNGATPVSEITEGNGLSNLRRRLEQEGATLEIRYDDGIILVVTLPAERETG